MRKYEEIWKRLKSNPRHAVTIEVHPSLFDRVIKAVTKEKNSDLGMKLLNDVEAVRLRVSKNTEKRQLTFRLTRKFEITELKVS